MITHPVRMFAGVLVAGSLASCASEATHIVGPGSPTSLSQQPYQVKSLKVLRTFEDGAIRLTPPPTGVAPRVPAADAFAAFIKAGVYVDVVSDRTASMYVARMTSYAKSIRVDPDTGAALVPDAENELVWVIEYTGVPDRAVGPGRAAGQSAPARPQIVEQDVVVFVDSDTGRALAVLSVPPEDPPSPVPTADPAGKPSG